MPSDNEKQDSMPGAFPGAAAPSFEEPGEPGPAKSADGRHVHFEDESLSEDPNVGGPPQELSQVPPPVQAPPQVVAQPDQPDPPPSPPNGRPGVRVIHPQAPLTQQLPAHPPHHPHQHVPVAQPANVGLAGPPLPPDPMIMGYGPPGMPPSPLMPPMTPRGAAPWTQGPPINPLDMPFRPPPWEAEMHQTGLRHHRIRRRPPMSSRLPPPRPRVQYQDAPPAQIQVQHQQPQAPQIQVQHIPAPQAYNNNGGGGGGGGIGEAMQMMMMNNMMMQQMGAQQMQAAQFGAMVNNMNGGGQARSVEARADASCGGSGGFNVQNCQNQAGVSDVPVSRRRRRVRKRRPKPKSRSGGVRVHVGQPGPRVTPIPPRINRPAPPPPIDGLGMDNWQEATIILCLAIVALIYLVASRNSGGNDSKKRDPKAARAMAT